MLEGETVVLADGTVLRAVKRPQKRQTVGWFVPHSIDPMDLADVDDFPKRRRGLDGMWEMSPERRSADEAPGVPYLILCPEDELDPPESLNDPWFYEGWDTSDIRPAELTPKRVEGAKKVPLHLVPPALGIAAAAALGEGARKYGPYDWRTRKPTATAYVAAMLRHLYAYMDGEDIDPDSEDGKGHLDGVAGTLAILLDATHGGFLVDDRPTPGPAPRLLLNKKD